MPQQGLTTNPILWQTEAMTNTATPAGLIHCTSPDHEGVQRPGNGFFYVPEREHPTYCTDCAAIATAPRTPELVALEVALAKAHYYDAATLEEQNDRFGRLVALEDELAGLDAETERDTLPHPDRSEA